MLSSLSKPFDILLSLV